jgi:hypothetical protein
MSVSAAPTMMTAFGLYQEEENDDSFVETERITHLLPLLEGSRGEKAEDAAENTAVLEVVESLREDSGSPELVQVQTIRWRGQSEASIRAQLQPILLHYRMQILLVRERTLRRSLEMSEANERVPLVTAYYKRTPVKWRLVGYMGSTHALLMTADSESMYRTPASTVTSVSEAKREQQFRESFMRLEDTVLRQSGGGGSDASTPVRHYEDGRRSPGACSSFLIPTFSPAPMPPKGAVPIHANGTEEEEEEENESDAAAEEAEAVEALDSTVAFVDPVKRR